MFSLTEVACLSDGRAPFSTLKPWWDVFTDYLVLAMLAISIIAGTLLISTDQLVCLPVGRTSMAASGSLAPRPALGPLDGPEPDATLVGTRRKLSAAHSGHPTNLDYQQYLYIGQVCYHQALPWHSKYSPYLALLHALLLMVCNNFWFIYPKTSSRIELFLSILQKCFHSPWTTKALSETACQPSEGKLGRMKPCSAQISQVGTGSQVEQASSFPSATILDQKDREQAKALFEKIHTFRAHTEAASLLYWVYVGQTVFKVAKLLAVLGYASSSAGTIAFRHMCRPGLGDLAGHATFSCTHSLAYILQKLLLSYLALVLLSGLVGVYTLYWLLRRSLREYSFGRASEESSFRSVPNVCNDLAFLLHMADQYDPLCCKRIAIFLSTISESQLLEIRQEHRGDYEELRRQVGRDAWGRLDLRLCALPALPQADYQMADLEVLRSECMVEVKLSAKVAQMGALSEVQLYRCRAMMEPMALAFLQEWFRGLHVQFTDITKIPSWLYSLKNLRHMLLSSHLYSNVLALESLWELRSLEILLLQTKLTKLPCSMSTHICHLCIQNDGTELEALGVLKKMSSLQQLELLCCQLERIPPTVWHLTGLQRLDLHSYGIRNLEEGTGFQHLAQLTCLNLWHNHIATLPASIGAAGSLEELMLSHNELESLPHALFTLKRLRHLDLSYNLLRFLPAEIGQLGMLQHLSITGNRIRALPSQLFACLELTSLQLVDNALTKVPAEIGRLVLLSRLELTGNPLESLPLELGCCPLLKETGLSVDNTLFETLLSHVKQELATPVSALSP
ncbi:volume-regulated anion channel subunit LRRC8D-like [Dermochelys coriacea]|uniref:volume-regulated anion channel subunit LRRC8D-like n=1 Tax=Dermochelys coriacea TaxID=27794 RepID=UPI0018E747EA|nr:volume-regulated anion channel subunit LRRC8D-like [Dermochelys coriacea]